MVRHNTGLLFLDTRWEFARTRLVTGTVPKASSLESSGTERGAGLLCSSGQRRLKSRPGLCRVLRALRCSRASSKRRWTRATKLAAVEGERIPGRDYTPLAAALPVDYSYSDRVYSGGFIRDSHREGFRGVQSNITTLPLPSSGTGRWGPWPRNRLSI